LLLRCRYVAAIVAVSKKVSYFFFALVLVNLAIGVIFFFGKEKPRTDLSIPSQAVDALEAKSLYFSPAVRAYLVGHRPELVPAELKKPDSEQTLQFAQAAQDPTLWRKLARDLQFDTVLLTGEPGEYRPLLRHLLASKDWTLSYLDHTSLVFKRQGEKSWIPEDLNGVLAKFSKASSRDRATVLAQLASKLLEITQYAQAKKCLDQALELDKKQPEIWTAKALYQLHFGQWPQALETANKALELDPDFLPALSAKAQLLFNLHRFQEALPTSQRLVKASPANPQVLLLHAKIAHETEDYSLEAETLKSIIELADQQHTSTTGYRLFLAQAYAHNGNAIPALEQFQRVLQAPDITEDQRNSVQECIATIQEKIQSAAQSNGAATAPSP
jgi:tetratricopeptide (TPR) repeat protein